MNIEHGSTSSFNIPCSVFDILPVRMEGLEPPYLTASDPKSDVSTNFTTSGDKKISELEVQIMYRKRPGSL